MDVKIFPSNISGSITAPPSKSYTHRAIILASLAKGKSTVKNVLISDDTIATISAMRKFGAEISQDENTLKIKGTNGFKKAKPRKITADCANSGTTARLATAIAAIHPGTTTLDGSERLKQRPMSELFNALRNQEINIKDTNGHLPVTLRGGTLKGDNIDISGKDSSQFISALLIVLPFAKKKSLVKVRDLKSKPYLDITIDLMKHFGIKAANENNIYFIPKGSYKYTNYTVEGDYSSASYFLAASAVTGSSLEILGLNPYSKQGDKFLLEILAKMGCAIDTVPEGIKISGRAVNPVSIDMANYPDIVPTVAAVAATIDGKTQMSNIAHLHLKESDRIDSLEKELTKMGAQIKSTPDSLIVRGGLLHGAEIDTHHDHRIAMSLSIAALVGKGDTIIKDAKVVEKSYKDFWPDLQKIGVQLKKV